MDGIPVLFFRDFAGDVLAFMPNTEEVLDRLRFLALRHQFEVAHWYEVLVVSQGDAWSKAPKNFKKPVAEVPRFAGALWVQKRRATMAGGGPVREACRSCGRSWNDCGGFENTSPRIDITSSSKQPALSIMKEAVTRPEECPLYVDGFADKGTIKQQDMRALGFVPVSSVQAFTSNELTSTEYETLHDLVAKGINLGDWDRVSEAVEDKSFLPSLLRTGWGKRTNGLYGKLEASSISSLDFDPLVVEGNQMAFKVRGGYAQHKKRAIASFRKRECARCVYDCEQPPWDLERPCALTMDEILERNAPDDDDLVRMGLYTITGEHLKIGRRNAIGRRPMREAGEWGIEIVSLVPPYHRIGVLSAHEYWSRARKHRDEEHRNKFRDHGPKIDDDVDKERLAIANWALRMLHEQTRCGETHFIVNDRTMRNDILFMHMNSRCDWIDIGSDTRASSYGGFGAKGDRIETENRPRFKTSYMYPFFEGIWGWFGRALGARGGRRK